MITHEQKESYPTDLSDREWEMIEPHMPKPNKRGWPLEYSLREILNTILYLLRAGCAWRMLPHDFPPWQTVYYHFCKWRKDGDWERLNQVLREGVATAKAGRRHPARPLSIASPSRCQPSEASGDTMLANRSMIANDICWWTLLAWCWVLLSPLPQPTSRYRFTSS